MILKSLYLKNYRTYRGPEYIKFAHGDKNITIIQGNNEVGKTTIMNAITWCLYGRELYKNEGNEPIWNKNASYDLNKGDEDKVEVIISMEDSKGKKVRFCRDLTFYKNDSGNCMGETSDDNIYVDDVPVSFKSTYLNKHLPEDIREYFLFDGEQLESYFKEDNKNIKKSINKLSQLNLLDNIKKHLNSRKNDFNDELSDLNPSLGHVIKKINVNEKNLENNKQEVEKKQSEIKKWKKDIEKYNNEIKRYGDDPEKLIDEKIDLNKQLDSKDDNIKKANNEYNKFLFDNFPKILSINCLLNVQSICYDLEEKGFIPSKFKKEFLEYLLEQHECICGSDLSEGTPAYNKLKELYDKTSETTNISDEVNILLGSVNNMVSNFPTNFKDNLINKRKQIKDLNSERENISKSINEINEKLSQSDEDEISKLQKNINTRNNLIDEANRRIGACKSEIKRLTNELNNLYNQRKEEENKNGKKSDLEKSIEFCENAYNIVNKISDELNEEMHSKLNELTSKEFEKMHWKEFYHGVTIDKDYNVIIHKENADVVPNDLSKGGQLVLALSFMTALNSLSGFELPIIIDTPLGRLDEPIKENIGKYLPVYTKNKQVTLLVTSSEYTDAFRKGIRDYVGEQYELNFIQERDGMTTIESKK